MRSAWVNILLVAAAAGFLAVIIILKVGDLRDDQELVAKKITWKGQSFDWIKVDPAKVDVRLYWKNENNEAYSTFGSLNSAIEQKGKKLLFATNAGIFSEDFSPGGLHVENGKELHALNLRDGEGNFHMKPNGVFYIEDNRGHVTESVEYTTASRHPQIATQSGPMLVVNGNIHPAFTEGSDNRNIRNGVGVDKKGYIHFAVSNERVNFHDFASLFLEALKCPNALYLDGSISDFYLPALDRRPDGSGYCGIIAVVQ